MNRSTFEKYYSISRFMDRHGRYVPSFELNRQVKVWADEVKKYGEDEVKYRLELVNDATRKPEPTERQARITELAMKYTGEVYVYFWGRDCDLMESATVRKFANKYEAEECIDDFYDCAEGACNHAYVNKEYYDNFEPWSRDRAAEQAGY